MSSQMMVKEKELTKLKEDNKLLVKQFRGIKGMKRRETIPEVCLQILSSGVATLGPTGALALPSASVAPPSVFQLIT